jgi:predicted O-linked N-acetylglucosamine transferase (SPINDLY family)
MNILREVKDSVLWLIAPEGSARPRVQQAAAAAGVDPARLVFAPIVDKARHLERLRHADLFLDTFFYNAHTTASDALSQGVPVLTRPGIQFQSRVAASLINTLGLTDELVTKTPEGYVQRAIQLARDGKMLGALRKRVRKLVQTSPLYQSALLARDLETLYEAIFDQRGSIRG